VVKCFTQIANFLKVYTVWENFGHRIWKATLPEQNICIKIVNIDWGFSWSMAVFLDCPLGVVTASVHVLPKESVSDV